MITPLLEKAIGQGKAYYTKYTHAFSTFGSLVVPDGKTVIVVDIKWNNFFSALTNVGSETIREVIRNNEFQLKIDGNKSVNYMTFRNQLHINLWNAQQSASYGELSMDSPVIELYTGTGGSGVGFGLIEMGVPIIQDVFFICEKSVKLTITRNVYGQIGSLGTIGNLNATADEKDLPNGVNNANLLLYANMVSPAATSQLIAPPNKQNSNAPNDARLHENYIQDINGTYSILYSPFNAGLCKDLNLPFATSPLVELGLVIINSNEFDKLMNS